MALELIRQKKKSDPAIQPTQTSFHTSHQGVAVTVRIGRVRDDNTRRVTITARSRIDLPCRLDLRPQRAPRWFFSDDHAAALGLGGYSAEGAPLAVVAKLLDEQIRRELDELPVERLRVGRRQVRLQVTHPVYEPDVYPRELDLVARVVLRASDAVALADLAEIEPSYRGTVAPSVIAAIQVQRRAELERYASERRVLLAAGVGVVVAIATVAAACC
jgi:hypothetical protein